MSPITHPLLVASGIRHGFFTREGGVSRGLYTGLNAGVGSNDDPAHVAENRRRVAAAFGATPDDLAGCYQIHSAIAHVADGPWRGRRPEGDAVATATPVVLCTVLTADCAPVLLADATAGVVGAAHAGWKGAIGGVLEATLEAMASLGADPARTVAVVGPTIGPRSYEVDADYRARFLDHDPDPARFFVPDGDRWRFDLPAYVLDRLSRAGVSRTAWTGHDTLSDPARFYSNRRAHKAGEPDFGRMISVIALNGFRG